MVATNVWTKCFANCNSFTILYIVQVYNTSIRQISKRNNDERHLERETKVKRTGTRRGERTVRSSRKRREQTNPPAMVMSSDEANLALYISSSDSVTAKSSSESSIDRPVLAI